MKLLYILLVASVVLAAAQAAAIAIGAAAALGIIVALWVAPKQTLASLVSLAALGAFAAAPVPALAIVLIAFSGKLCATHLRWRRYNARRRSGEAPKLLPPPPES